MKDLWRIQKAAFASKRYSITINNEVTGKMSCHLSQFYFSLLETFGTI